MMMIIDIERKRLIERYRSLIRDIAKGCMSKYPPHRPVDQAKQDAILIAAREEFFAVGYAAASIERIAAAANVSKVTICNHFQGKENLFSAMVEDQCSLMRLALADDLAHSSDFRAEMISFARSVIAFLSQEDVIRFERRLGGEVERHPEIAALFLEAGPHRLRQMLTQAIASAMDEGHIARADPDIAASHLFGLIRGFTEVEWRFSNTAPVTPDDHRITDAVDRFLRAYSV